MDKYYIPKISELFVGYQYEEYNGSGWYQKHPIDQKESNNWKKMKIGSILNFNHVENLMDINNLRVPYLTKEDIESLGWKLDKNESYYKFDTDTQYTLRYHFESKRLIIEDEIGEDSLFRGTIKSINELKYLSKLLNIE